jgi:IMP dehydrogenase/GMP reductase
MTFQRDEEIVEVNNISCTKNHEFYVVRKSDAALVTEDNIHQYAFWIEAEHLNEDEHLLVELKFKLVEITSKRTLNYNGPVHDLTVEEDHSYNVNKIIVHNSICKTRIQTGFGVPTLASLIDVYEAKQMGGYNSSIIADGGIKYPADLVKSLVAGADAIIAGSLFAGTKEAPGQIIHTNDGLGWKSYRGMASSEVQADRKGGLKPGTVAEGVSMLTPYKGSLSRVVEEFVGGLRSGMTYANAKTLSELRKIKMIKITNSGISESHAHGTKAR